MVYRTSTNFPIETNHSLDELVESPDLTDNYFTPTSEDVTASHELQDNKCKKFLII